MGSTPFEECTNKQSERFGPKCYPNNCRRTRHEGHCSLKVLTVFPHSQLGIISRPCTPARVRMSLAGSQRLEGVDSASLDWAASDAVEFSPELSAHAQTLRQRM